MGSLGTQAQAADDGQDNLFTHNFWDEWRILDADFDGIVDTPYPIISDIGNVDNNPLSNYNNPQTLTFDVMTRPIIVSPNGSEIVRTQIKIIWATATDFKGHAITYDVNYTTDGGTNWAEIATGITDSSVDWLPGSDADHMNCRIMVVATCSQGVVVKGYSKEFRVEMPKMTPSWTFVGILSVLSLCLLIRRIRRKSQ